MCSTPRRTLLCGVVWSREAFFTLCEFLPTPRHVEVSPDLAWHTWQQHWQFQGKRSNRVISIPSRAPTAGRSGNWNWQVENRVRPIKDLLQQLSSQVEGEFYFSTLELEIEPRDGVYLAMVTVLCLIYRIGSGVLVTLSGRAVCEANGCR